MGVACPAPLDVQEILKEQQAQQAAAGVRRGERKDLGELGFKSLKYSFIHS